MAREVLHRSFDASGVPAILASPSNGVSNAVVIRSEIEELIAQVNQGVAALRSDSEQGDSTLSQQLSDSVSNLEQQIALLGDRVVGQLTVGAVATTLEDAYTYVSGLAADIPATSHLRLVLVASESDLSINGIYTQQGSGVVRADGFTLANSLRSGFKFFVDQDNQQYVVLDDAAPVSTANQNIASVAIAPWTRVEEISARSPIRKINQVIELLFNAGHLAVVNGELSLSAAFLSRITAVENIQQQNSTAITTLQGRADSAENRLGTVETAASDNTTAIASTNSQIVALQTFQAQTESDLGTLNTDVTQAKADIETLESSQAAQDTELGNHSGQISELSTDSTQLKADVQELKNYRVQHDGLINTNSTDLATVQSDMAGVKSKNSQQDARITAVEAAAALLSGIQAQQATNTNKIAGVETLIADANTTIAAHTGQITDLGTQLLGKVDTSALTAAFQAFYASQIKSFVLTGGISEQRVDLDDNITYHFTTFTISTGFGHLNFRSVDLSDALAPYTKLGYAFTFQRVETDSLKVSFQHNLAAFPDDKAVITVMAVPAPGN